MATGIATQYNLGPVSVIPAGEGRMFRVGCTEVAVFRAKDGTVYATQSLCPHKQGPLADGIMGSGLIICPLHGFKFELATGLPVGSDCEALKTYSASVSDTGELLLDFDD
ncbi:MAG TPA: Rieske (2Fe-2S) protein [Blastocatellia bacterium]|nr:Rieske (2Fe-2S) protein [Blastocatellia bacterium]